MRRAMVFRLVGCLAVGAATVGAGCQVGSLPSLGLPRPPVIIPDNPAQDTLTRSFTVDLRDYPATQTVNWEFGDGAVKANLSLEAGRVVAHQFAGSGVYEVKVHLFSGDDWINGRGPRLLGTGSLPLEVVGPNANPVASFTVAGVLDELGVEIGQARRFDGSGSRDPDGTIAEYRWDFGDGSTGIGKTVEHTYSQSSRYVVRLTAVDNRGGLGTATRSVLLNSLPTAAFTFSQDPSDALRFDFDASGSSDPDGVIHEYRWDFDDGTLIETGQTVSHRFAEPDDYNVRLTVVDEFSASASVTHLVDVTGDVLFVRSITPDLGEVGATMTGAMIDGENFESGASVRLVRGGDTINADSVTFVSVTMLEATFNLAGAALGEYAVVVENPGGETAERPDAFRVVTPNLVRLETTMGDIVFELVDDAPITTGNFLQYVKDEFYDGTIFHRVVADFVVQGGGMLPGPGLGTPQEGLRDPIQNEFSPARSNVRGTVAMAKLGDDPDSATSQFFVNLADNSGNLDNQNGGFTVFANVIEGMDVVDAIAGVAVDENDRPLEDVLLTRARRE